MVERHIPESQSNRDITPGIQVDTSRVYEPQKQPPPNKKPRYVEHSQSGLPIRLPPYLRRGLGRSDPASQVQLGLIRESNTIGQRGPQDTVEQNLTENIRLRRVARIASQELNRIAEKWGIERFCTIVHGSLARGLVRQPNSKDPSDVDIDLIIDGNSISKEERRRVRQHMYEQSQSLYGARVDTYVWTREEVKKGEGYFSRLYIGASVYPIAKRGDLWEEIYWIGTTYQHLLNQEPRVREKIRKVLAQILRGVSEEEILQTLQNGRVGKLAREFLTQHGFLGTHNIQENVRRLL